MLVVLALLVIIIIIVVNDDGHDYLFLYRSQRLDVAFIIVIMVVIMSD